MSKREQNRRADAGVVGTWRRQGLLDNVSWFRGIMNVLLLLFDISAVYGWQEVDTLRK